MYTYLSQKAQDEKSNLCIVMLHGLGSDEKDLFHLKQHFQEHTIFSLRAPFELDAHGYAWYNVDFKTGKPVYRYEDIVSSARFIQNFLDYIRETYFLENKKIVLFGFSQGAILSYYTLYTYTDSIDAIVGLSGRLIEELQNDTSKSLVGKKVFVGHGAFDGVIKVQESEKVKQALESSNVELTYKVYTMPHSVSAEEITDIQEWLKTV